MFTWHDVHEKFKTPDDLKEKLQESFGEHVPDLILTPCATNLADTTVLGPADQQGRRARSGLGWALIEVTVDTEVASAGVNGIVTLLCILETLGIAHCLAFPRFCFLLGS